MKTINTRFGEIEYDPNNTILFPEGLVATHTHGHSLTIMHRSRRPQVFVDSI